MNIEETPISKFKKILFSFLIIIFIFLLSFFLMKQKTDKYKADLENVPPAEEEWED